MLLIIVLLNYGTLAKLILAKLASKNRMPGFMRPKLNTCSHFSSNKLKNLRQPLIFCKLLLSLSLDLMKKSPNCVRVLQLQAIAPQVLQAPTFANPI